jgi:hypothetical protein
VATPLSKNKTKTPKSIEDRRAPPRGCDRTFKAIDYTCDECRQALVKIVIINELPFNFMDGNGFRLFSRTM